MKFYTINYSFFSDKVNEPRRIVLISDLHDMFKKPKKALKLIEAVNCLGGHHVAIAGDVMQGVKYSNSKNCGKLAYLLEGIAEAQPVIMSLGNHDLVGLTEEGRKNFRNISHNPNVHTLDNESFIQDEFRITGFSTGREAYAPSNHSSGVANMLFAEDWKNSKIAINPDSKYFEELVGHAPHPLASPYVQCIASGIEDMDLYLAGHLHNGYLPINMSFFMKHAVEDMGIWKMPKSVSLDGKKTFNPLVYKRTHLCRGMHTIGRNGVIKTTLSDGMSYYNRIEDDSKAPKLIVSGGINRLFGLPSDSEITTIDILPEKGKSK